MINQIVNCNELMNHTCRTFLDAGIEVSVFSELREEAYVGIKVDNYYHSLQMACPPKSVDFIVSVDCECSAFVLYILELKNVSAPKFLDIKSIQEKFYNTIEDFMKKKFDDIFNNPRYKYKDIKLYLVSNAYQAGPEVSNHAEYQRLRERMGKIDSLKVEVNLAKKIFLFRNRMLTIQYDIPPNPIINRIT